MEPIRKNILPGAAFRVCDNAVAPDLNAAAHLWIVSSNGPADPHTASRFRSLLDAGERARLDQLHFFEDQMRFLLSHALVRSALSHYRDVSPEAWQFTNGQGIRPEIAGPMGMASGLRFNLTHTKGLVACVVTLGVDCGVDAECREVLPDIEGLAKTALHPQELRDFGELPQAEQLDGFLALWTAKEACMKACGRGLSMAPDSFALETARSGLTARVLSAPDNLDWQITLLRPTSRHHLAIALDPSGPNEIAVQHLPPDLVPLI